MGHVEEFFASRLRMRVAEERVKALIRARVPGDH